MAKVIFIFQPSPFPLAIFPTTIINGPVCLITFNADNKYLDHPLQVISIAMMAMNA